MDLREAKPEDADAILDLVRKTTDFHESLDLARFGVKPDPFAGYRRWLGARIADESSRVIVAEQGGQIVAMIISSLEGTIPLYRVAEVGYVHELWVEPDYRNEGLARQLVTLVLEHFKSKGVAQVRLEVAMKNEPARKLFEQCGFRIATHEMLCELT